MRMLRAVLASLVAAIVLFAGIPVGVYAAETTAWFGDVDQSGSLSTTDVRELLLYTVGQQSLTPEARAVADYNEDFAADTSDARAILLAMLHGAQPETCPVLAADERALLNAGKYSGEAYVVLCDNQPLFTETQKTRMIDYEEYALADDLGRCGAAYANLSVALMPTEERESIGSVTPTGWHNNSYDCVPGGWVYNRSHIVGFQLAGEQANKRNLITGTRYLNTSGMLPFENEIAAYVKATDCHVLYRVTPRFTGNNLLCDGVEIEAWSVEDNGEGICLHVFCYNVQPGVVFNYATGENHAEDDTPMPAVTYILNTSSKKFHLTTCGIAASIIEQNRAEYDGNREELIAQGYTPCGNCNA